MARLTGFPPLLPSRALPRALVLGSFPSIASLELGRYYGNERNHFWPLLAAAAGRAQSAAWDERYALLEELGLAVWDVIGSCEREGSLDTAIDHEEPNPILALLASETTIQSLALNGGKAATSFLRFFAPELGKALVIGQALPWRPALLGGRVIDLVRLPSTSPIPTKDYKKAGDKLAPWLAFLAPNRV
jgi:TDG/mug DNA glycosylase family protein